MHTTAAVPSYVIMAGACVQAAAWVLTLAQPLICVKQRKNERQPHATPLATEGQVWTQMK